MPYQLNLLSTQADRLSDRSKKRKSWLKSRFSKTCTTKQAAILLGVSTSTLYRARQIGQVYVKKGESAESIGFNRWRVTLEGVIPR